MRRLIASTIVLTLLLGACSDPAAQPEGEGGGNGPAADGLSDGSADQAPSFQLVGKVVDDDGDPVSGATVAVGEVSVTSADDGWFDLSAPATGPVEISKPAWESTEQEWDGGGGFMTVTLDPVRVRGLRVSGVAAGDDDMFAELLTLADETAVNALVFDTKQEGGTVLYDTAVQDAHDSDAVIFDYDAEERIADAKDHGLYTITRIVTFQDDIRAEFRPKEELAEGWLDPQNREGWEYPLALGVEACQWGFDEVQYDYVRWPSGPAVAVSGQLDMSEQQRVAAIEAFLREAYSRIAPLGCAVSADVFAVTVGVDNDQGIGQMPEELSRHVDVFSPMVYPSHYSAGWDGFKDPNEHPYDVTVNAIDDALPRMAAGTILRPWLQAFWWTDAQIRSSIQAAEDRGVGWILWNAVSNFDREALPSDADVSG